MRAQRWRFRWRATTRKTWGWTRAARLVSCGASERHPAKRQAHRSRGPGQGCSSAESCVLIVLLEKTFRRRMLRACEKIEWSTSATRGTRKKWWVGVVTRKRAGGFTRSEKEQGTRFHLRVSRH